MLCLLDTYLLESRPENGCILEGDDFLYGVCGSMTVAIKITTFSHQFSVTKTDLCAKCMRTTGDVEGSGRIRVGGGAWATSGHERLEEACAMAEM